MINGLTPVNARIFICDVIRESPYLLTGTWSIILPMEYQNADCHVCSKYKHGEHVVNISVILFPTRVWFD